MHLLWRETDLVIASMGRPVARVGDAHSTEKNTASSHDGDHADVESQAPIVGQRNGSDHACLDGDMAPGGTLTHPNESCFFRCHGGVTASCHGGIEDSVEALTPWVAQAHGPAQHVEPTGQLVAPGENMLAAQAQVVVTGKLLRPKA
jgi:hypothetical protein